MLRITQEMVDESTVLFRLEGKLLGPWIEETLHAFANIDGAFQLDLSGLSFTDAAGSKILADLICSRAQLTACSPYIAALLHVEKS